MQRIHQRAAAQPDLAAALEVGRDGAERAGEGGLDVALGQEGGDLLDHAPAAQRAATERDVEQAEHGAPVEFAGPIFELVESARGVDGADQGARRRTTDDVGGDARRGEPLQHSHMGEAACTAAAESDADPPTQHG